MDKISLPRQSSRVLFRVLEGLRLASHRLHILKSPYLHQFALGSDLPGFTHKIGFHSLTPLQSYYLYTTGFKGLINWPEGFFEFLNAQTEFTESKMTSNHIKSDLGNLYNQWLAQNWSHSAFDFVQEAFDEYIIKTPSFAKSLLQRKRLRNKPEVLLILNHDYPHT